MPPLLDANGQNGVLGGGAAHLSQLYAALCVIDKPHNEESEATSCATVVDGKLLPFGLMSERLERLDAAHCAVKDISALEQLTSIQRVNLMSKYVFVDLISKT